MKTLVEGFIESNKAIGKDSFHCKIHLPLFEGPILPGQFVQISCPGKYSVFLKRPISVFNYEPNHLELIYKVVGDGTKNFSQLLPGQSVEVLLPLGNSFSPPLPSSHTLLIAGGIGIAPLFYYLRYYQKLIPTATYTLLSGVSQLDEKLDIEFPKPLPGKVLFHADIQEGAYQGNLLDFLVKQPIQSYDFAKACGPTPMMHAFSSYLAERNIGLEVSLESNMACGYGVCLGCAFPTNKGSKTVCNDGPVFNSKELDWNQLWKN